MAVPPDVRDPGILRIGSRGSTLALVQARLVQDALRDRGIESVIDIITTQGDTRAADTAWGDGAFVSAIEERLAAGAIDIAVHSAKDLPTEEPLELCIAAFLPRASAADVLVLPAGSPPLRSLDDLPGNARVGTDSPRRTAFLRRRRPDLRFHALHGNVDTRLRRLDSGDSDVLVLAEAGLSRLGRVDRISLRLEPETVPPAPGQGALAVQVRAGDAPTRRLVESLDDASTRGAVEVERALLRATGGGCRAPIGALARATPAGFELVAGYAHPDGSLASIVRQIERPDPSARKDDRRERLLQSVLDALAAGAAAAALAAGSPAVLVTRAIEQSAVLMLALVDRGLAPIRVPSIAIATGDRTRIGAALQRLPSVDWVAVTSANTVRALRDVAEVAGLDFAALGARVRWAVIGRATGESLRAAGVVPAFVSPRASAEGLAATLPVERGSRVLAPQGDLADGGLVKRLTERGAEVESLVAYRTIEAPPTSVPRLREAIAQGFTATLLTSGSTARGLAVLADRAGDRMAVLGRPAICIGPETAVTAAAAGFTDVRTSSATTGIAGIADSAAAILNPSVDAVGLALPMEVTA